MAGRLAPTHEVTTLEWVCWERGDGEDERERNEKEIEYLLRGPQKKLWVGRVVSKENLFVAI
jgi:hypothetical protein